MRRFFIGFVASIALPLLAVAQPLYPPINAPTTNGSVKITTGNTYQQLIAATSPSQGYPNPRHSITIQSNNTNTDNCFLIVGTIGGQVTAGTTTTSSSVTVNGVTLTAAQASILLTPGLPYQRYFPYVPSDALFVTCASTGDSVYLDTQ